MRKFFQYINRKPKAVRDNYAFGIAAMFTGVVLMFWVIAQPNVEMVVSETDDVSSPFSTLIKETKEKFSQLGSPNEQASGSDISQSASVINSSSTGAGELILNQEDIEKAQLDLEKVSETNTSVVSDNYTEVMIGTTSASVSLSEEDCFDTGTSSSTSCFGSIKTSSTTLE